MQIKKYLFYTRYILILLLIVYLILIWMYFKDNVSNTTSTELINCFVVIPLIILASIVLVHWQYNKKINKSNEDDEQSSTFSHTTPKRPLSYDVFMHSYVCLPEGERFIDIIENSDDLTVLSLEYTSFDNLPILIKPIEDIISYDDELYPQEDDIDSITHRICLIIRHLLIQNESEINKVVKQFVSKLDTLLDKNHQDLTLSMHPKWQQSHILSENQKAKSTLDIRSLDTILTILPIYLLIPDLANKPYIKEFLIKQLISYGFSEDVIDIRSVTLEGSNEIDSQNQNESLTPLGVIKNHIISISQNQDPQLSLVIGVDSQINDEWLEEFYYTSTNTSSIVPEEAGVILFMMNEPATSLLEIEDLTAISMLEFPTQNNSKTSRKQSSSSEIHFASNMRSINMRSISNFIQLELLTSHESDNETNQVNDNHPLAPFNLTILSDISPLDKPYNLNVFMRFIDNLVVFQKVC